MKVMSYASLSIVQTSSLESCSKYSNLSNNVIIQELSPCNQ